MVCPHHSPGDRGWPCQGGLRESRLTWFQENSAPTGHSRQVLAILAYVNLLTLIPTLTLPLPVHAQVSTRNPFPEEEAEFREGRPNPKSPSELLSEPGPSQGPSHVLPLPCTASPAPQQEPTHVSLKAACLGPLRRTTSPGQCGRRPACMRPLMGDANLLLPTSPPSRALTASDADPVFPGRDQPQGETSLSQSQHQGPSPGLLPVPGL